MKKKLALLLAVAMFATFILAGCGSKEEAESAETKNSESTFVVGFDAAFPPYGYVDDDGEYVGFDLELAQEVCERKGWTLVKQPIDWEAKDMEIDSGNIDCIWNGFTINTREDEYTWSEPYIDNKQVFVVCVDSGIKSFEDLAGKMVETQVDSSALKALETDQKALTDTFAALTQIAEYNTAFMDLESGVCDAIAMDIGVAYYQMNSRENPDNFMILDQEISSEQYGVGFKLGNEELRDQVQATLDEMAADGTVAEIAEKYADFGVPGSLCIGK